MLDRARRPPAAGTGSLGLRRSGTLAAHHGCRSPSASCPIPTSTICWPRRWSASTRRRTSPARGRSSSPSSGRAALRAVVKEELDRFKLPAAFVAPAVAAGRGVAHPPEVRYVPVARAAPGRGEVAGVRPGDPAHRGREADGAGLHGPDARAACARRSKGVPAALVFRNGEFDLVDARPVRRVSRLLLVRHGQSTWNADGRWQGHADPPLSELGVRQAEARGRGARAGARRRATRSARSGRRRWPRARRTAEIVGALHRARRRGRRPARRSVTRGSGPG